MVTGATPPILIVNEDRYSQGQEESADGHDIHELSRDRLAGEMFEKKLKVGVRQVVIPQARSDLPVPVSRRAITEPIPDAQPEPGKHRQADDHQMSQTCLFPGPAEEVEKNQTCVKDKKELVQKIIKHQSLLSFRPAERILSLI